MKHRGVCWTLIVAGIILSVAVAVFAAGCGGEKATTTTTGAATVTTSAATETTAAPATETTTAVTTTPTGDQPVLRIGFVGGAFPQLNPWVGGGGFAAMMAWQVMYGTLVGYDAAASQFKPELAESWTTSSDGVTYTFKLRSGAVWSDGQPITSKDAAFTLNTILGGLQTGLTVFWGPNVSMLAKVEAPDDLTLVVTLAGPSP
jgi:peptide/nickel transport system substrate-binding protein